MDYEQFMYLANTMVDDVVNSNNNININNNDRSSRRLRRRINCRLKFINGTSMISVQTLVLMYFFSNYREDFFMLLFFMMQIYFFELRVKLIIIINYIFFSNATSLFPTMTTVTKASIYDDKTRITAQHKATATATAISLTFVKRIYVR